MLVTVIAQLTMKFIKILHISYTQIIQKQKI